MEQLNVLLNAGHSPSSLARQMVRYLRNALMAKLGGEQTELLQISVDERARAARTALLFTEEELTRNLQIVLRTFDDLNYRQEQRFHLELGLLKLVHAQRLLPLEELLSAAASGVSSGPGTRSSVPASGGRSMTPPPRAGSHSAPTPPSSAATPTGSLSPFGTSAASWNAIPNVKQSAAAAPVVAEMDSSEPTSRVGAALVESSTEVSPGALQAATPFPPVATQPAAFAAVSTEGALARMPEKAREITGSPSVETLRLAVISALADAGHASAAQLLGAGTWTLDVSSLRIEVAGMGKKMLSLTINAAAEKIMRQEMQRLGGPAPVYGGSRRRSRIVVDADGRAACRQRTRRCADPSAGAARPGNFQC